MKLWRFVSLWRLCFINNSGANVYGIPFNVNDISGSIYFRMDFNDITDYVTGSFSTDGGNTYQTFASKQFFIDLATTNQAVVQILVDPVPQPPTPTPTPLPTPRPDFGSIMCYKSRETSRPKFEATNVILSNELEAVSALVKKPMLTCVPVDINGNGISDPDIFLTCYKIKSDKNDYPDFAIGNILGQLNLAPKISQLLCIPSAKEINP